MFVFEYLSLTCGLRGRQTYDKCRHLVDFLLMYSCGKAFVLFVFFFSGKCEQIFIILFLFQIFIILEKVSATGSEELVLYVHFVCTFL